MLIEQETADLIEGLLPGEPTTTKAIAALTIEGWPKDTIAAILAISQQRVCKQQQHICKMIAEQK